MSRFSKPHRPSPPVRIAAKPVLPIIVEEPEPEPEWVPANRIELHNVQRAAMAFRKTDAT